MNSVTFALDLKSEEDVIRFFRVNKTQISCIDEPNTFLNQLRDHGLVEEELHQKVTKMRNRDKRQDGVYQILNLIEKQGSHGVKKFWRCVFQDHILNKYPVLRTLLTSLLDGTVWVQENMLNAEILTGIENCETVLNTKGTKRKTDESEEGGEGSSASSQKKLATFSEPTNSHHESRSTPCFNDPLDQVKDDACYVCNEEEGVLVHCKQCPRAFHCECHLPVVQDQTDRNNWVCTFCVVKTNQQAQIPLKREDVLDCPVSGKLMHCQYLLLCMYKGDDLNVFTDNPSTTDVEENSETSKTMWLNKVKTKLQNKKYTTVGEFVNDIHLIFSNCQALNSDNEFGIMGAELKEMFEREFQTIFKIK